MIITKQEKVSNFPFKPNAYVDNVIYLLDNKGNLSHKFISPDNDICVISIIYSIQVLEIVCKINKDFIHGFIKNTTGHIKYKKINQWENTNEYKRVYHNTYKNYCIGSLAPFETATPLYYKDNAVCLAFNTPKGVNTKSGFVFNK